MSWEKVPLGSILAESKMFSDSPDPNKRIKVRLNVAGVEKRPFENEIKGATKQFVRKAGQFIYGRQNFHKGAFGIIPQELDGYETSADIPSFDIRKDCLAEWIFYFFKIGDQYLELEKIARGVGSKRIHPEQISNIRIPLPPIEVQKKLIAKLKKIEMQSLMFLDSLADQQSSIVKLRQQILQDAVSGKLTEDWRKENPNVETALALLEKIKAEKEKLIKEKKIKKDKPLLPIKEEETLFEIPESWKWCRLGEITEISSGIALGKRYQGNLITYPYLRVANVQRGFINTTVIKYLQLPAEEGDKYLLENNDVLVNEGGDFDKVGRCALWKGQIKNCIHQNHLFKVRSRYILSSWLEHAINSDLSRKYFLDSYKKSTNLASLNKTRLTSLPIALPPLSEQYCIVQRLEQYSNCCNKLENNIKQNQAYTEQLLQVALKEALEPKEVGGDGRGLV